MCITIIRLTLLRAFAYQLSTIQHDQLHITPFKTSALSPFPSLKLNKCEGKKPIFNQLPNFIIYLDVPHINIYFFFYIYIYI